ncbi:M14 family zinc carboxypeptidase [Streptomyces sp. NPDC051940]|uniref:M14 family metallopeptidase n=1 Tax=Streptomyces sp. NPDC051940 TaxID=3155675 RepID=UPI00342EA5B2
MRTTGKIVLAVMALLAGLTSAAAGSSPAQGGDGSDRLELYKATVDAAALQGLQRRGYDIANVRQQAGGTQVELVLTDAERDRLRGQGISLTLYRDAKGRTQRERAAAEAAGGFTVYRSYDEPGGIRDELYDVARSNPGLVKLEVLGKTGQGREYIALKVTAGARGVADGARPAVLYASTYHAREWIGTEVNRRLLHWYLDRWRAGDPSVKSLLQTTELWFVLVHNPDGYQYTFDHERLWRKNLRDNDGDGVITGSDGVDPNRNHSEHWNYDDEGSSSLFPSQTYRGAAPESEPETRAMAGLFDRVPFKFAISYHSYGPLLLYPQGWQTLTPSADDPVYVALTGRDTDPAVPGFNPGVSADLYTTNGEFTDWAHATRGTLAWTPELEEGCAGCGFVFPDDESLVQAEFAKNLDFARRVAQSALDPDDPVSHIGLDTKNLYVDESAIDPWKTNWPTSDLRVDVSYAGGSSQPVEVLAKRAAGRVTLHYTVNGGPERTASTKESPDGERYGGNNAYNVYYHYLRGSIPGLHVGDSVAYWFTARRDATEHVAFDVVEDSDDARVLIVAAEDRTGASTSPAYASTDPATPNQLSFYEDALTANGIGYDVYDVDARGRRAPDHLGVLGHYDAVVWYRGNDVHVREPGWPGGNVSRLAVDETLEIRQYLNEGGRLLYTGQWAGATENGVGGNQLYDPVANAACTTGAPEVRARCLNWGDKNDFLQYYLGAYLYVSDAGFGADGNPFPVNGVAAPFIGPPASGWTLGGGTSADNQVHNASFLATSGLLDPGTYPQFTSSVAAKWDRPGGPFAPHTGDFYASSGIADISYKRLAHTVDVPAGGATVSFWTSYDTEPDWDFVFAEAHTVGQDDWTTLADANGHTTQNTGQSCLAENSGGWRTLHPHLDHYQTQNGASVCDPAGSTGAWHAASGNSGGWQQWQVDLGAFAGKQVEVSVSYASDWSSQGLGVFVDDFTVSTGQGTTSFEAGLDGWTVPGAPAGSSPNSNDFARITSAGFPEGPVAVTSDTVYFGFGLEGITEAADRNEVMGRAMAHLLS